MGVEERLMAGDVSDVIGTYWDVLGAYGEQQQQAARFGVADAAIDDINKADFEGGCLTNKLNHALVFTRRGEDGSGAYGPHCSAFVSSGFSFLGDRLVRVELDLASDDPMGLRARGLQQHELVLVDTAAGVGVNVRSLDVVAAATLRQFGHYRSNHAIFLDNVAHTEPGGHIYWSNSPL